MVEEKKFTKIRFLPPSDLSVWMPRHADEILFKSQTETNKNLSQAILALKN